MKVSCLSRMSRVFVSTLTAFAVVSLGAATEAQTFDNDVPALVKDDGGPDDYPGQKDLNYLELTNADDASAVRVRWGWDDTVWNGNNTGDACVLFDNDAQADGLANLTFCVTVEKGGQFKAFRLYTCSNGRADRCTNPALVPNTGSTAYTSTGTAVVKNTDPFTTPAAVLALHSASNSCSKQPGCITQDTEGQAIIRFADFGGAETRMINVCTYPSQEPNSAPSDCVITPNNGLLTIVKAITGSGTANFVFTLGTGQQFQDGTNSRTIAGAGSAELISMAPGTLYDVLEAVPTGWKLTAAGCMIAGNGSTGTTDSGLPADGPVSKGVQDFEIKSGIVTTCTFTNEELAGTPTIGTTQSAIVTLHDAAAISGLKTDGGAASVEFRVYNTLANCQAWGATGQLFTSGAIAVDQSMVSVTPDTSGTTGYAVPTPFGQTVYWGVKYSGNSKNNEVIDCSERTVVGIVFQYAPFTP